MSEIIIPLKGTTRRGQEFDFSLDDRFLEGFGRDILEGMECGVHVAVRHRGDWIEVSLQIAGRVKVLCDRCLEEMFLPVEVTETLSVRFDAEPEDVVEEDDNVIILREGTPELDLSQTLYDLVCVSVPMCRVHPEGECNPEAVARLSREEDGACGGGNTPFTGLKDMLEGQQ